MAIIHLQNAVGFCSILEWGISTNISTNTLQSANFYEIRSHFKPVLSPEMLFQPICCTAFWVASLIVVGGILYVLEKRPS